MIPILLLLTSTVIGTCLIESVDNHGQPYTLVCKFKDGTTGIFNAQEEKGSPTTYSDIDYQPEILMETIDRSDRPYTIEDKSDENSDIQPK